MLTAEERAHLEAIRADFAKHEEGSAADTEFLLALVDRLAWEEKTTRNLLEYFESEAWKQRDEVMRLSSVINGSGDR